MGSGFFFRLRSIKIAVDFVSPDKIDRHEGNQEQKGYSCGQGCGTWQFCSKFEFELSEEGGQDRVVR